MRVKFVLCRLLGYNTTCIGDMHNTTIPDRWVGEFNYQSKLPILTFYHKIDLKAQKKFYASDEFTGMDRTVSELTLVSWK